MHINEFPISSEYDQALIVPKECFKDLELKTGVITIGSDGYVYSKAGRQSRLYRVITGNKTIAVRCFVSSASVIPDRYRLFQKYLGRTKVDCLVDFQLLDEGIFVNESWFPVVKMPWLEGSSLDKYIDKQLHNGPALAWLAVQWQQACRKLVESEISHGDLENSNIIISDSTLKIVDYDTIFFPGLAGFADYDTWHPNFQHPERTRMDYGSYVDNFSTWVIFISLFALSVDPSLWLRLEGGEQNLLFRHGDFRFPPASKAFYLLDNHENRNLRILSKQLKSFLNQNLITIPDLRLINVLLPDWQEALSGSQSAGSSSFAGTGDTGQELPVFLPIAGPLSPVSDSLACGDQESVLAEHSLIDSFIAQVSSNPQTESQLAYNDELVQGAGSGETAKPGNPLPKMILPVAAQSLDVSVAATPASVYKQARQKRSQKQGQSRTQIKQAHWLWSMFLAAAGVLILLTVMVFMAAGR